MKVFLTLISPFATSVPEGEGDLCSKRQRGTLHAESTGWRKEFRRKTT